LSATKWGRGIEGEVASGTPGFTIPSFHRSIIPVFPNSHAFPPIPASVSLASRLHPTPSRLFPLFPAISRSRCLAPQKAKKCRNHLFRALLILGFCAPLPSLSQQ